MIHYSQTSAQSFLLPTCKGIQIINTANLIRIEAMSNYSKLFFADGSSLVVAKILKWFIEKLPAAQFLRSHRKHIVNIHFIDKYYNSKIEMCNAQMIEVSKRKRMGFLRRVARKCCIILKYKIYFSMHSNTFMSASALAMHSSYSSAALL